jgi:type I restriction enzyme S subunit
MADEWPRAKLSEFAAILPNAIAAGPFGSNLVSKDYVDSGVPVIRGQNLTERFVGGDFVYVTKEKAQSLRTNTARPMDIVFTQRGTLGQVSIVPTSEFPTYVISQSQMKLTVDYSKADPVFVYYACISSNFVEQIHNNAVAAGVPHINLGILRGLEIPNPPLSEQRAIAHILGTLDDKIELNRCMNLTLEAMARALFKSWFVDFDPVRAKAEGRDPGLPNEIADLFPSRLIDSELGEIPEGWEIATLADFADLNPETWTKQTRPTEIRYIDLSNTKWGRIETVTVYTEAHVPSRAQRVLRPGDTIVGIVRPGNGSYALISEGGLTGSTGFAVLRPSTLEFTEMVYLAVTAADKIEVLAHLADGGAYPAIRPEAIAATRIVRPTDDVLAQFSSITKPIIGEITRNECESRTLGILRDALLPKLISGEIRTDR